MSGALSVDKDRSDALLQSAQRLLHLEQRVDAYERLYENELGEIHSCLDECREQLLELFSENPCGNPAFRPQTSPTTDEVKKTSRQ